MTDSAYLYGLFDNLYKRAEASGYVAPLGYSREGVVTGLEQAVAFGVPSSQIPPDLHGRVQDGHIILERGVEGVFKEIARVRIPQPK